MAPKKQDNKPAKVKDDKVRQVLELPSMLIAHTLILLRPSA